MRGDLFSVIVATSVRLGAGSGGAQIVGRCTSNPSCTLIDRRGATVTDARWIDDRSQIVGWFTDAAQKTHGFLRTNAQFIPFDVPNADKTEVWAMYPCAPVPPYTWTSARV